MNNKKSTKRALLSSVLSLVLCMAMLIGTTFAWFTDSVTSAGNKIVAGKLDIQLLMDGDVDGTYDDISESTAPIFGAGSIAKNNNAETLWEPGKTQVAYLAIKNNGNLALKYTVGLDVQNVSKDLYEVMEYAIVADADKDAPVTAWNGGNAVTVGTQSVSDSVPLAVGATHYFALVIHMDEEAGNEYQGGEVNFDLTVLATQLTSEFDSFDNQYDKFADYDGEISGAASLKAALTKGGTYKVLNDIAVSESMTVPEGVTVALDLGGKTINGTVGRDADNNRVHTIVNNGDLTIVDGTIASAGVNGGSAIMNNGTFEGCDLVLVGAPQEGSAWPSYTVNNYGVLTLSDCNITGYQGIISTNDNAVTTTNDTTVVRYGWGSSGHVFYTSSTGKVFIDGGTYENRGNVDGTMFTGGNTVVNDGTFVLSGGAYFALSNGSDLTVNGGDFSNVKSVLAWGGTMNISGGTFGFNPAQWVADGCTVVDNKDGTYTVVNGNTVAYTAAELQTAIANAQSGDVIVLGADIEGDVAFTQQANVSLVIDGNNKTMNNGSVKITARAGKDNAATLMIKNFNFTTTDAERTFIVSNETNYYPNNITISNCTFEGTGANSDVVAVNMKSANKLVIENCKANNVHSLLQNTSGWNLTVKNCEVTNAGRGMSLGTVQGALIDNVKIDASAEKYGIRIDAAYSVATTIKDCEISAFCPVVVRKASENYELIFNGENTMNATNTDGVWCAIGTSEYEFNGNMPTDATGSVKVTLNDIALNANGIYGAAK